MIQIEIIATTGNKFIIPGGAPGNQVTYGRKLIIQHFQRNDDEIQITFDINEMARFSDFKSSIDNHGGSEVFFIRKLSEELGFDSRIFETVPLSDLIVGFKIYKDNVKNWDVVKYI